MLISRHGFVALSAVIRHGTNTTRLVKNRTVIMTKEVKEVENIAAVEPKEKELTEAEKRYLSKRAFEYIRASVSIYDDMFQRIASKHRH